MTAGHHRRHHAPRVLMVLDGPFPSRRGGGAEKQVGTLSRAMRRRRQRVTVVTPMAADGPREPVSRVDGVPVCRLRYPRIRWVGGPVLWLVLAMFLLRRRHRYDAWHVHVARSLAAVCTLLGPWLGKRVVVKVSGSWDLERGALAPGGGLARRVSYRCLRRADAWQAISHQVACTLIRRGIPRDRIVAIPNAIGNDAFEPVQRLPGRKHDEIRLVFVGRLVEEKDLPTLIEAFSVAVLANPALRLLIVGTGPMGRPMQKLAEGLGIEDQVAFLGHREDVPSILANADFGILPSRIEGLSNALLECMAAGLPMIGSRISGNEDFIRDGDNGWLFEPGDREALSAVIALAASIPEGRRAAMGRSALETVARQAGIDSVLARLQAAYRGDREGSAAMALERSH